MDSLVGDTDGSCRGFGSLKGRVSRAEDHMLTSRAASQRNIRHRRAVYGCLETVCISETFHQHRKINKAAECSTNSGNIGISHSKLCILVFNERCPLWKLTKPRKNTFRLLLMTTRFKFCISNNFTMNVGRDLDVICSASTAFIKSDFHENCQDRFIWPTVDQIVLTVLHPLYFILLQGCWEVQPIPAGIKLKEGYSVCR